MCELKAYNNGDRIVVFCKDAELQTLGVHRVTPLC